jgi:hypothetical protein
MLPLSREGMKVNKVKPGKIVLVRARGFRKTTRAIVIRTYTDGGVRAVSLDTEIGKKIEAAVAAGNITSLKPLTTEIEGASLDYFATEFRV